MLIVLKQNDMENNITVEELMEMPLSQFIILENKVTFIELCQSFEYRYNAPMQFDDEQVLTELGKKIYGLMDEVADAIDIMKSYVRVWDCYSVHAFIK